MRLGFIGRGLWRTRKGAGHVVGFGRLPNKSAGAVAFQSGMRHWRGREGKKHGEERKGKKTGAALTCGIGSAVREKRRPRAGG